MHFVFILQCCCGEAIIEEVFEDNSEEPNVEAQVHIYVHACETVHPDCVFQDYGGAVNQGGFRAGHGVQTCQ